MTSSRGSLRLGLSTLTQTNMESKLAHLSRTVVYNGRLLGSHVILGESKHFLVVFAVWESDRPALVWGLVVGSLERES